MKKQKDPIPEPVYDARSVAALLGITYSELELSAFGPPPDPLPGFLTFFDPGFSILYLRLGYSIASKGSRIFQCQDWYFTEDFAKKIEEQLCYRQLRMKAVKKSFFKPYSEQLTVLPTGEEVPLAHIVVTGTVVHFLASGKRLFPSVWVRCRDMTSDGSRVCVGRFGRDGLRVVSHWDDYRSSDFGLASSRKF